MPADAVPKKFILYPHAPWFFALAIIITWIGFSQSYFSRLSEVGIFHHVHGATAGAWMFLLILQPILYKKGKLALHRKLGWIAAFTLVPLLVLGGLKMMHLMMGSAERFPPGIPYQLAFIDAFSLAAFLFYFISGIRYSKNIHLHARYMALTVLIVMPPAISRLLFLLPWFQSWDVVLDASFFIMELTLLLLLVDDHRSGKIRRPYIIGLIAFVALHILVTYAGQWEWWRNLMDNYGKL